MARGVNNIMIKIGASAAGAVKEFKRTENALDRMGGKSGKAMAAIQKAAVPAALALGGIAVGAKKAVGAASDLSESMNKTELVFGKSADSVKAWGTTTADAMGIAKSQALDLAANFGGMFIDAGKSSEQAARLSEQLIQRSADLGSAFNVDPTQASEKIQAALRGEYEGVRALNIAISEATVKNFAYSNGIAKTGAELTEGEKQMARYGLIMQKSSRYAGDFANTSDDMAGAQRILKARMEDMSAELGTALLPAMEMLLGVVKTATGFMRENTTAVKIAVVAITGLSAAVVGVSAVTKVWTSVTKIATAAQKALDRVLKASPWVRIATIVIAAGTALYTFATKTEAGRAATKAVWDTLKGFWDWLSPIASVFMDGVKAAFEAVKPALTDVKDLFAALFAEGSPAISLLKKVTRTYFAPAKAAFGAISTVVGLVASAFSSANAVVSSVITALKGVTTSAFDNLTNGLNKVQAAAKKVASWFSKIKSAWNTVKSAGSWLISKIPGLGRSADLTPTDPSRLAYMAPPTSRDAAPVTVSLTAADQMIISDEQIARAIGRLLARSDMRNGFAFGAV